MTIKDDRPGTAGVPACPRPGEPTPFQYSWLGWTRAGGDACGPRTIVFDYFPTLISVPSCNFAYFGRRVILCGTMRENRKTLLRIVVVLFFCHALVGANAQTTADQFAKIARTVTIYRDTYGVPHVFGRTDASTAFGFAYAQAEDNFWRVEENFINALGRASEVYGEKSLSEDRLNHALEIPRLAREEYARLDGHMRSLCDAFAAGFNYYLERH